MINCVCAIIYVKVALNDIIVCILKYYATEKIEHCCDTFNQIMERQTVHEQIHVIINGKHVSKYMMHIE